MAALTPVQLQRDSLLSLHAANPKRYPVLLESAARGGALGRFDILLACPREHLILRSDGVLSSNSSVQLGETFLETLDRWWTEDRRVDPSTTYSPFSGGWFLFLGYELAGQIEPTLSLPQADGVTTALALRVPAAIVVRHSDGAAWIVEEESGVSNTATIQSDIVALELKSDENNILLSEPVSESPTVEYIDAVKSALNHIVAGDIYQANLSREWRCKLAPGVKSHEVYRRLRRTNPAPFAALAVLDDFSIVSSTPERLVEVREGVVSTRPIAGTRARHINENDDAERLRELLSHPKERAEHVMLIDLERNDLGRVCEAGSVEVNEFMSLESYTHVHHIVSNVRGRLRPEVTPGQVIAAVFPGGTITGCPKVRCMEIIGELESSPRHAYTGSMGYLNTDGSMDLNILIRTIEICGERISFRAGAGIVADSIPERELEETRAKARGLVNALTS
jgi:anthranilate synthase component 1